MCFSAQTSFGLCAILLPVSAYCVHSALAKNKALLSLGIIPLIFGVQQFCEGIVWTGIDRNDAELSRWAALVFLFFALAFWPFWIPFCAFLLEPGGWRRPLLGFFSILGLAVGVVLYVPVLLEPGALAVEATHHSLYYDLTHTFAMRLLPFAWWQVLYVVIVATPPLTAPSRGFFIFGVAVVVSAAVSHVFFWYASASVWCFFAAVLSLYLSFSFWRLPTPASLQATA